MPTRPSRIAALLAALLYAAAPGAANAAGLDAGERAALAELATGTLAGLEVHDAARPAPETPFLDGEGAEVTLADFRGKVVLVNFWATWCPPCVAEMPSLDALATEMAGEDFAVVPVSTDFGGLEKPRGFYEKTGISALPLYLDATQELARAASVPGLPVTLLLDREGREVARLTGDAHWDAAEAKAVVSHLISATAGDGA